MADRLPNLIPASPQISEENLRQLAFARRAGRKVRRAASVASFDGWTIGIFGALTLLIGLTDPSSIVMGLGMGVIAFFELRGAARLRRLEPKAAKSLALNQLALAVILIIYALWRLHAETTGPGPYEAYKSTDPELAKMLQPVEGLTRQITLMVYWAIIAIAVCGQGSLAVYYFTRGKHIRAYLEQTPAWIIEMQRAGVPI